eukprot:PhF_6_TR41195/c0_g1_i1/m.62341
MDSDLRTPNPPRNSWRRTSAFKASRRCRCENGNRHSAQVPRHKIFNVHSRQLLRPDSPSRRLPTRELRRTSFFHSDPPARSPHHFVGRLQRQTEAPSKGHHANG